MEGVPIAPGVSAYDLALLLERERVLVLGDVHVGLEESLREKGVLVPRFLLSAISLRLTSIFNSMPFALSAVIINGDLKHQFGRISDEEWRDTLRLIDVLKKHCPRIVVVKGNHDILIGPILQKRGVEVVPQVRLGNILVVHGDEVPPLNGCDTIIIGHEHPAIGLKQGNRIERFKCFLKGDYKGKTLIALPSFNVASEGTDVLREVLLSPFLKRGVKGFEVFIVGDRVYPFGRVDRLNAASPNREAAPFQNRLRSRTR